MKVKVKVFKLVIGGKLNGNGPFLRKPFLQCSKLAFLLREKRPPDLGVDFAKAQIFSVS